MVKRRMFKKISRAKKIIEELKIENAACELTSTWTNIDTGKKTKGVSILAEDTLNEISNLLNDLARDVAIAEETN